MNMQVCLFSDPNFFALNILENLLSRGCVVNVITSEGQAWQEKTTHIASKSKFFITSERDYKKITNFSYAVFCGGFIKRQKAMEDFKVFISNKNFGNAKTLAVFPFETFSHPAGKHISIGKNAGVVYIGDLLGARIDLTSNLLVPRLIKDMIELRRLTLGIGELFYPILVTDAARIITKWLLGFGPYGKETFLLGPQVSTSEFWKSNMTAFPDLRIIYDTDITTRSVPRGHDIKRVQSNLHQLLGDTYRWIIRERNLPKNNQSYKNKNESPNILQSMNFLSRLNRETNPSEAKKHSTAPKTVPTAVSMKRDKKVKKKLNLPRIRILKPFLLPIFLVLFFPVLTSLVSGGFLYWAYKDFLNNKIQASQKKALFAKTVFVIGKHESEVLKHIPVFGNIYKEAAFTSYIGENVADAFVVASPLANTSKNLLNNILGNGVYDVTVPSQEIKSGLDYLYQQISLVHLTTEENASNNVLAAKQLLNVVDFATLKNVSQQGAIIASKLPEILGHESNKNYLVLFQNNMELRPTGGFIGSYGIATFGGGRLNGLTVNDIYSADGQLRGHVEPPEPIKKYLDEANWWFRDSNWDPDFPTSAQRAEWFLGKEMGQKVDGVIGIDLTPIKNILAYTGPIFLPDYNLTISSENIYEKTQEEAQANFFPGSRKKASFLTALSRVLLNEITNLNSNERIGVLNALYTGLEERSIQIYMHDKDFQASIGKLNWDGRLPVYACGTDCYSDFFGDVEANVGVNKANYFLSRKLNFSANINGQSITRDLNIQLENKANTFLGASGQYQVYIRLLIPSDAEVVVMTLVEGGARQEISPEITQEDGRKEVGAFIEINPKQTKQVNVRWKSDVKTEKPLKSYGLYVRKQAGTVNDPITVKVNTPEPANFSLPAFSLTKGGAYTYNTNLNKDFFARLSWR